jgi:hypothetical protein
VGVGNAGRVRYKHASAASAKVPIARMRIYFGFSFDVFVGVFRYFIIKICIEEFILLFDVNWKF